MAIFLVAISIHWPWLTLRGIRQFYAHTSCVPRDVPLIGPLSVPRPALRPTVVVIPDGDNRDRWSAVGGRWSGEARVSQWYHIIHRRGPSLG